MTKAVAQVVLGLLVEGPFDYFVPSDLRDTIDIGKRVKQAFLPSLFNIRDRCSREPHQPGKSILS